MDHRPDNELEHKRIIQSGGTIYKPSPIPGLPIKPPTRVLPGRLSVSRAFGDLHAKDIRYNGNPNVIISIPDITSQKLEHSFDFIFLGCNNRL